MKILILALLATLPTFAQSMRWTGTTGEVAVNTTTYTVTIQQPASGAKAVTLESATVNCTVACKVTFAQNGTAASATAGTLTPSTPTSGTPATKLWIASNVGTGTTVPGTVYVPGGTQITIDLSKITLPATSSTAVNFSILITTAATCTANLAIFGSER